jgi:hypothetical protein
MKVARFLCRLSFLEQPVDFCTTVVSETAGPWLSWTTAELWLGEGLNRTVSPQEWCQCQQRCKARPRLLPAAQLA